MKDNSDDPLLPKKEKGVHIDAEDSETLDTVEEAVQLYERAKNRLLYVNGWHHIAGRLQATFQLTDEQGKDVNRPVQKGDHFKIDIPGPGSDSGKGYDWAKVESVEEKDEPDKQSVLIRVRPAANPQSESTDVAHFFDKEGTSSFTVIREGTKVVAGIYDRNVSSNKEAESVVDTIRHMAVATGAISFFSKLQWKSLVKGVLKKDD